MEAQSILNRIDINSLFNDAKNLEDLITREKQNQNFLTYLELCLIKMAEYQSKPDKKVPVKQKEEKVETKEEEKEEVKAEPVVEEVKEVPEITVVDPDMDFLLAILLNANKDLKISDQIIYNKLDLYAYEPEKRKFYQLLIGTELFASNKDAIIICGNRTQADNINTRSINEELYCFINKEFGIDKMVYAIDQVRKNELINMYKKTPVDRRNKPVYVEKYKIEEKREATPEEKLKDLFGDVLKVEE